MPYQVLDNGKPADTSPNGAGCKMTKGIGWDNSRFNTIDDAYKYAHEWLGPAYAPYSGWEYAYNQRLFEKPYAYSDAGDKIQIVEVR